MYIFKNFVKFIINLKNLNIGIIYIFVIIKVIICFVWYVYLDD